MESKKKELVREALNDDALMDVTGGGSGYEGNEEDAELLECPQCHGLILCTPDCPIEKHMKSFCSAKKNN